MSHHVCLYRDVRECVYVCPRLLPQSRLPYNELVYSLVYGGEMVYAETWRAFPLGQIHFEHPIKAIYVKPNPGNSGSGIIDSITYRNITGNYALWYPIWIGPQQQQQPGSNGTGCSFLYPSTLCPVLRVSSRALTVPLSCCVGVF